MPVWTRSASRTTPRNAQHADRPANGCSDAPSPEPDSLCCRICLEVAEDPGELISPCMCKGTQLYVHPKCLRRWQETVRSSQRRTFDDRASRCSVCRARFRPGPPPEPLQLRVLRLTRGVGRALAVAISVAALLVAALLMRLGTSESAPVLYLSLAALLGLAIHREAAWAWLAIGAAAAALIAMQRRGVRVVLRLGPAGQPEFALIRQGGAIPPSPPHHKGLGAGSLLVASRRLDGTLFGGSVVLITEHSAAGARGIILNRPYEGGAAGALGGGGAAGRRATAREHFGGPVSGAATQQEVTVLHTHGGVLGSRRLLPRAVPQADEGGAQQQQAAAVQRGVRDWLLRRPHPPPPQRQRAALEAEARADAAASAGHGLMVSGGVDGELREALWNAAPHTGTVVRVYRGACVWTDGQLEGEVRHGDWGFVDEALPPDVTSTPPEQLMGLLAGSARVTWLA